MSTKLPETCRGFK